jgi:endoglucanase
MTKISKHIITTVYLVVFIMSSISCKEQDVEPEIALTFEEATFTGEANDKSLNIETNTNWTATVAETWCAISATSGSSGITRLRIIVTENNTLAARQAIITFSAGSITKNITVTQSPLDFISFSKDTFDVAATGGEISLTIQSSVNNFTYTIPDWITLKTASIDNTSQTFTITENSLVLARTGLIIYTAGSYKDTVIVEQTAKDFYITPDAAGMSDNAVNIAPKMYAGWNLGNTLEATGGETAWGNPLVTQTFIDSVKAAGFNAIRIPCAWDGHLDKSVTYKIQDSWLSRVKQVVDYCYKNNMYVILNIHWDGGWLENNPTYTKQDAVNKEQKALWLQIAYYFRDYDQHLLFAGTNEVHANYNTPTTENITVQQSYNQTFLDAVRSTGGKNYYRNLIVQSYNTNIDYAVNYMKLPTDVVSGRMLVEVHYYDPWDFCGETSSSAKYYWGQPYSSLGVSTWGQETYMDQQFSKMKTNFVNKGYPVILGEYGPIRRSSLTGTVLSNHLASRAYYLQYITQHAKDCGLIPFYWDNGVITTDGNGIFNRNTGAVFDKQAVNALNTGAANGNYPY